MSLFSLGASTTRVHSDLDACTARRSEGRVCAVHWYEFVLCLPVYVLLTLISTLGLTLSKNPRSPSNAEYAFHSFCMPITDKMSSEDYSNNNNLTPFISMQNHYSLLYREEEREMFPTLKV